MIQYFNKSTQLGPLKQIPIPKQALKIIRISYPHNAIQKINPSISKAQNLQEIYLSYNKIIALDPIFQLRKLRVLDISNNQISNIGKGILKLKRLQKIDLTFNLLSTFNSVSHLLDLFKLRKTQLVFLLQGNKVIEDHQQLINQRTNAISEEVLKIKQKIESKSQLKELQISKCFTTHKRTNSNPIESYTHSQNYNLNTSANQVMNQVTEGINHQILGSLSQSRKNLQGMLASFMQYERKFDIILSSQFKGWNENLLTIYRKQGQSVKTFIQTYKNMIKALTTQFDNASAATIKIQTYSIQASEVQQLIKDQHFSLLQALSQYQEVPMTNYKIWVQFYRQIRAIAEKVRWQACNVIQCQIRNQQIEALKLISPSKEDPMGRQLQGLLFSKTKQNKQEDIIMECSQCFIKNEEIKQLKQLVQILSTQNSYLKEHNQEIIKENNKMQRDDAILGRQLRSRQEFIIEELQNKIDVSVYQKVFLEQARGIEDLIKCDRHLIAQQKQRDNLEYTQKMRDLCQTATAIAKDKAIGQEKQVVSQFHSQYQSKQISNKQPYFSMNTKGQIDTQNRRSKKNTQNSTQKKKKSMNQNNIKDFQSGSISGYSNSRSKTNLLSRKVTQKQSEYSSVKKGRKISQNSQNKKNIIANNLVISDFALTQTGKQKQQKQKQKQSSNIQKINNRKALAELIIKKTSENMRNYQKQKINKEQFSRFYHQTNSDRKQNTEEYSYQPGEYMSINLKSQQPYKNYMKYHLRNSIIEILDKKGKRYSLSKQGVNMGIKEATVKMHNNIEEKDRFSTKVKKISSATKFSGRILSDRQIKLQAARLTNRYHSNSKSYVEMVGKLRH